MARRWGSLLVWMVAACVIAGGYGAVHNQVSYTVSPDYFHAFKFRQFRIAEPWRNRLGAAAVGWRAAWWMGLLIGPALVITAHRVTGGQPPRRLMAGGILAVLATTLLVGAAGLAVGFATVDGASLRGLWIPAEAADPVAFTRAGILHDASYLGGGLGVIAGCGYVVWRGRRHAGNVE